MGYQEYEHEWVRRRLESMERTYFAGINVEGVIHTPDLMYVTYVGMMAQPCLFEWVSHTVKWG